MVRISVWCGESGWVEGRGKGGGEGGGGRVTVTRQLVL